MSVTLVMFDSLSWTPAQHLAAAAVLGDQARSIVQVIRQHPDHDMRTNLEAERIAVGLAKDAAYYAHRAMEGAMPLVDPETVRLADHFLQDLVGAVSECDLERMREELAGRIQETVESWFGALEQRRAEAS